MIELKFLSTCETRVYVFHTAIDIRLLFIKSHFRKPHYFSLCRFFFCRISSHSDHTNGPITVLGVYVKSENATKMGGHAVKLIGWGEEYGVPYWLMINSWNDNWGDNGVFKIRRGTNECGIDNSTTAGVPVIY